MEVVFVLRVVPVQEGPWAHGSLFCGAIIWQLLYTLTAMVPPHAAVLKNPTTILGHQDTLNTYMKCQTELHLRKRVTLPFQHDPYKTPNIPFFYGRLEKQLSFSKHQWLKLWYLAPLLSWQCTWEISYFSISLDHVTLKRLAPMRGVKTTASSPVPVGPIPSVFKYWLSTSFQKGVPERLNRAW